MAKARIPKQKQKKLAKAHIEDIFDLAGEKSSDKTLANNLTKLARKIAMKVRIKMPTKFKRRYCKHCYTYLTPNKNQRVRIQNKKVVITCQVCKKFTRIPITPKRKLKNKKKNN